MAGCEILDWKCIFVSELVGTPLLSSIVFTMLYFIAVSRLGWGFDASMSIFVIIIIISALMISGFTAVMAFTTIIIGFMLSWIFNRLVGNR